MGRHQRRRRLVHPEASRGTVYALAGLENNSRTLVLKSITASPETKVTLLGQEGDFPWEQTPDGLKIKITRKQTIRLVKAPPAPGEIAGSSDKQRLTWGPIWPVAVKITKASPAAGFEK